MRKTFFYASLVFMLLSLSNNMKAQDEVPSYIGDSKGSSYRDRLIDYVDIFSYDVNEQTKDTILYVRKINDYWYGIFGSANFDLSFGNFNSLVDPNNPGNIFNAVIDFASKFGMGYTFGIMGEWVIPTSDLSFGLKLGAFDKKITHIGADGVDIDNYFDGNYDFSAKLTYLTLNPYAKYSFPQFDGLFVTGGFDVSIAYSSFAYLERKFDNTGSIQHDMIPRDINGKTRFLINLGIGYDFFIADFFATNNRVRVTPFADFKGGTNIITSNGSNWNDIAVNIGLQIKLAPDIVTIDTLRYDPNSEIPVEYIADIRNESGVDFSGFTALTEPPGFDLASVTIVESTPEMEDLSNEEIQIDMNTQPTPTPEVVSPAMNMRIGDTLDFTGFVSSTSTALTNEIRAQLDEVVNYLKAHPNEIVRIDGHSDNQGTGTENMTRSQRRADAAFNYIVSQGIPRRRVFRQGRGGLFPITTNNTETGRRQNRRVSIVIQRGGR